MEDWTMNGSWLDPQPAVREWVFDLKTVFWRFGLGVAGFALGFAAAVLWGIYAG
jgi:hypothetical protein